ncbi:Hypothetical predicted protein [Mytilus galloprovincialis]|nr:Hypothetical predicted protein [Mytilus galloprovincialis]
MAASGSREEKFLETFFPLISQFAFDKAKDLTEKEKEIVKPAGAVFGSSSSVFGSSSSLFGSTWGLLVHCLAQFVTAEKAYMSLSFLEQKGFFHRSKDLKSLYQNLITEIKKVEDSSDQSRQGEFEELLAHLSGHLCHYLTAKLKTMEFYEQISAMGTMKVINYSDLVIVITDIVQSCSKSFHHPLLSPLKATFGLECDAILHLLQAQILMSDWKFLASLMQLYEAHTKLTTWGATAQLKEIKKSTFGSSSKHSGWPALYLWLTKYKGFLLSKFSLYFYDVLQKHTTNNEMKGLITKATEDFVARLMTFQRRSDAHYVSLVLDVQSLGSSYIGPGYNHPQKHHTTPQGLDSFHLYSHIPHSMDENSDSEDTGDKETPAVRDLNELFDHSALRNLVSKFKEEITENVLQQYRTQILRWLDDKDSKQEETISIAQFCDWLMTKSVSRDDAIKTFQQFDTDGSGVVETSTMIETVKSMSGPNLQGELGRSIRMMQACSLTPGFVDVYAGDKNAVKQHAEKILKYLLRNRCPSSFLPFPLLNGFNNTANMRASVLKHVFKNIKESGPSFTQEGVLGSGEELRTISPCHSNIEVSSNSSESYRLTNGDPNTYWQSDGTARSHWIRLHTKTNVVIKTLSVAVASSDSSYMPELIHIVAGKNFRSLRQLKEIRIPSHVTGDVVLLKNCKIYYPSK